MEITQTFYASSRAEWRKWLDDNHKTAAEIWLLYPRKAFGKPRVAYNDAVEEALCFGWIDGIAKTYDADFSAQRWTPRRAKSNWSELNKERARRLIASGQMTDAGRAVLCDLTVASFAVPSDIEAALKAEGDGQAWENFQQMPAHYQRIRIGFIEETRSRPDVFAKRLAYFVKMTAKNKQFGTIR